MNPVTFVIVNAATLILIYTGAIQVDKGILTQGQVVALVNYMAQILIELIKLANLIITITKAIACANRIQNVLDMNPSMKFPGKPCSTGGTRPQTRLFFEKRGSPLQGRGIRVHHRDLLSRKNAARPSASSAAPGPGKPAW